LISYVAFYVGPIQTGFLMAFLTRFRRNRNRDSCEKNATGTENTGIRRIPAGICNLGSKGGFPVAKYDKQTSLAVGRKRFAVLLRPRY
jgi:hypothetical protein